MTDKSDVDNEDTKNIADEEREKMLNAENITREQTKEKMDEITKEKELEKEKEAEGGEKEDKIEEEGILKVGEVEKRKKLLEESQKENRGKIRVPIGAIKIPGFLKTKDKNKEADGTAEEGADLLEAGRQKPEEPAGGGGGAGGLRATLTRRWETLAAKNPFAKKEATDGEEPKPRLLDRIKLPAVAVLPKKYTRGNKDEKQDVENGAEIASVETLDDRKPSLDDGMESIKLDDDDKGDEKDAEKAELAGEKANKPIYMLWLDRIKNMSRHEKAVAAVVIFLLLLIIIVVASMGSGPPPTSPPVINGKIITTTQCGPVEGLVEHDIHVFRGIPYAVPPLVNRRWKAPQPLNNISLCWDGVYQAHNTSKICWQEIEKGKIDGYEDCLTLDIYSPEVRYINPMPVVVLIDTVTLMGGQAGALQPTPQIVKSKEVVFVRPRFRLGVFGFLSAAALRELSHPPTSGNYGLWDIIVALQWVQLNIMHFGGDPRIVTVLGHRAGATLVTALTTSPVAKGLFAQAWATSGSSMFPGEPVGMTESANEPYINSVCPEQRKIDCLLRESAEILMENVKDDWRRPVFSDLPDLSTNGSILNHDWLVLDGIIIREHVWSTDAELQATLVIGTTAQSEASAGLWEEVKSMPGEPEKAIRKHIEQKLSAKPDLAEEMLWRYNSTWEGLVTMISDVRTVCPLLALSRARTNVTFYVATLARNHAGYGSIADVDLDVSAIMGSYVPQAPAHRDFVNKMQNLFYNFVEKSELPKAPMSQPILNVSASLDWIKEYPNCDSWTSHNIVPKYARKD